MQDMTILLCTAILATPIPLTTADVPLSTFNITVTDSMGTALPVKLTFLKGDGTDPGKIFDITDGDPNHIAVRRNVVYVIDGKASLSIPAGGWQVYASRGMEFGISKAHVDVLPGSTFQWTTSLPRVIDTAGWAGGDFHLHTLTHSGHGDSNMPERMISIAGEGVEFAVATDHNVNVDYGPTMKQVGADPYFTAVTGNEISASYGHFNAYPLDPKAPVIDWKAETPALFAETRANTNSAGIVPIIQVNHPRWGNIDYYGARGLDPWSGEAGNANWSWDFDAVEVMNENSGWGWYDAAIDTEAVDACRHSVMRDWINMINAGRRVAPMGNSDSHTVQSNVAGIPRTYVRVNDNNPAAIDVAEVADAVRRGAVMATTGPFITVSANGAGPGDLVQNTDGNIELIIGLQSAPWIPVDRIRVLANGDELLSFELEEDGYTPPLSIGPLSIFAKEDAWITVLADSSRDMAPVVPTRQRPIRAMAMTGPIRIDADGDGKWTPPLATAHIAVAEADGQWDTLLPNWNRSGPFGRAMLTRTAAGDPRLATAAIEAAMQDDDRLVRAAGIAAARGSDARDFRPMIAAIVTDPAADRALAYTAWATCDQWQPSPELFEAYVDRFGLETAQRYANEHPFRLPGEFVREWQVTGYFDAPSMDALAAKQAPEPGVVHIAPPKTKDGKVLAWHHVKTAEDGHLQLDDGTDSADHSVVYAKATVHSDDARMAQFTVGSDDGCRIWIGDTLVWEDTAHQVASPDAKFFEAQLQPGDNEILVKVLNGTGGFGLYLRTPTGG